MPRSVLFLVSLALGCGHADPSPALTGDGGSSAPARSIETPAREPSPRSRPALLRCPEAQEHGCQAIFRVPRASGEAQLFTLESAITNDMEITQDEVLLASQISFSTLVAYPKQAAGVSARRESMRLLDAAGSRIRHIARAGSGVVMTREQDVILTPLDGGPQLQLSTTSAAFGVASEGRELVWTEGSGGSGPGGRIMIASLDGGPARVLVDSEDAPQDVALDQGAVFWINWGNGYFDPLGQVRVLRRGATQPETLAVEQRAPRVITTGSERVFWVVDGPQGRALRSVAKTGGAVSELVPPAGREGSRGNEDAVRVLGEQVYYNAGDAVWAVGVDGAEPSVVARVEGEGADIVTFVVDERDVYVAIRVYDPRAHDRDHEG